ncbi:helix-turn-helix domain-containing protein [Candidatus Poribacteria bacterium]|nr:helix-turn-helix domain-containing protein [Candidatus Poribacteria bacterium]
MKGLQDKSHPVHSHPHWFTEEHKDMVVRYKLQNPSMSARQIAKELTESGLLTHPLRHSCARPRQSGWHQSCLAHHGLVELACTQSDAEEVASHRCLALGFEVQRPQRVRLDGTPHT